ncbi:MAG: hypothetical protein KGJ35_03510, partial [Patescibacteria group bacterium]|nr:hypothetical protein [Patescibacteria group bacterium]
MNPNQKTTFAGSKLESWAFGIIIGLAFLLPVAFLPIQYLQSGMIKGYLTVFAILAVAFLYTFSRIKAKSFEWFGGFLPYAILLGIILVLISSIGSGSFVMSFFGQGYEYSTAGFLILLAILGMISTFIFSRNHARNLTLYAALFLSFVLVALFQIVKLISPASLSFGGILSGATATLIGSWYDLGFFSAVVLILALTAFPRMPLGRSRQIVLAVIALVAVFFLVLIGMPLIWLGLALVFLSLAVVYWATSSGPWTHRLSWWNIGIFIVMALLSWKGNVISAPLITATNATYSELHLPWQMTLDVGTGSLKSAPIVGSGPNTFTKQYLLYKPASINQTDFWSVEFSQGSGFVPTLASTLGLAGIILIIILYTCYIRAGIKSLKLRQSDPLAEYFSRSSFFAAAFLSFIMLSYAPSYAVLVITVLLAGLFIGTEIQNGTISSRIIPFNFKAGFAIPSNILAICLVLIFAVGIIWYGMKAV